jgi:hypothetical protein
MWPINIQNNVQHLLAIREIQIILHPHFTLVRMAIIEKKKSNTGKDWGKKNPYLVGV